MRPYLAIIKDSFRAAMASRVLYVLLLLITLLLVVLAPLHLNESLDWRLASDVNVHKPGALVRKIVQDKESSPVVIRVWSMLPASLQKEMTSMVEQAGSEQANNNAAQQQAGGGDDDGASGGADGGAGKEKEVVDAEYEDIDGGKKD